MREWRVSVVHLCIMLHLRSNFLTNEVNPDRGGEEKQEAMSCHVMPNYHLDEIKNEE